MVEFWVTRSPKHNKYPGGLWRFWADSEDSAPLAKTILGPSEAINYLPDPDGGVLYHPNGATLRKTRSLLGENWSIVTEEEALKILLGGER